MTCNLAVKQEVIPQKQEKLNSQSQLLFLKGGPI